MPGFTLTNKAIADLKDIGRYIQKQWGREQRDTYLTMLDACFHQLAANPLHGKDCNDIRNGYLPPQFPLRAQVQITARTTQRPYSAVCRLSGNTFASIRRVRSTSIRRVYHGI